MLACVPDSDSIHLMDWGWFSGHKISLGELGEGWGNSICLIFHEQYPQKKCAAQTGLTLQQTWEIFQVLGSENCFLVSY